MSTLTATLAAPLGGDFTYTRNFAGLTLSVQQLGQWENSGDITPAVLLQAVNYGLVEGYDLMVQKWADYYTIETTFAVTTASTTYSVVTLFEGTFYKLRHMDFSTDGVRYRRMYMMDLEASYAYSGSTGSSSVPRYRLQGGSMSAISDDEAIVLAFPTTGTIKAFYIPLPFQFGSVDDTNVVKFAAPIQERLVVHLAHRDLLTRSDLPTTDVDREVDRLTARLRTAADGRDAGEAFSLDPRGAPRRYLSDEEWWP